MQRSISEIGDDATWIFSIEERVTINKKVVRPNKLTTMGVPERDRTSGLQIRNLSLYPLSYGIRQIYQKHFARLCVTEYSSSG